MLPFEVARRAIRNCALHIAEGNSNPKLFIPYLVDLYRAGRFPFDRLIRFYPFEDIARAFHDVHSVQTIKPVLRMDERAGKIT